MYPAVRISKTVLSPYLLFLYFKLGALEIEEKNKGNKSISIAEQFGEHVGWFFNNQHVKFPRLCYTAT